MHLEKETAGNTYLVYHFLGFFFISKKDCRRSELYPMKIDSCFFFFLPSMNTIYKYRSKYEVGIVSGVLTFGKSHIHDTHTTYTYISL